MRSCAEEKSMETSLYKTAGAPCGKRGGQRERANLYRRHPLDYSVVNHRKPDEEISDPTVTPVKRYTPVSHYSLSRKSHLFDKKQHFLKANRSATGAASSTVDMLRLEHPRTIEDVYNDTYLNNDIVEIREPASWLRQLAHQHLLAQTDLQRLRQVCGGDFDRTNHRIRSIERSYETLFQGLRYIYEQAKADGGASHEWMQTELMAAANASQQFTMDVWQAILTRNEESGQQAMFQAMQITRLNDALSFLQTADLQRNQEQAIFRRNLREWADRQQTATNQLLQEQQRLQTEVDSTQAAIRQVMGAGQTEKRNVPSYLQAAPTTGPTRRTRPPAIPAEDPSQVTESLDEAVRNEEGTEERLARIVAQTLASTMGAPATQTANAAMELQAPRVA